MAKTFGEFLVELLEFYDVDTVFGIPGVHTVELYRGLDASTIKHITPRHEQGAGFGADGYARVCGKPGVCLLVTGPGLTNSITAIAQAYADSIPMLVLSGVNKIDDLGHGNGHLHELPDQSGLLEKVTAFSHRLTNTGDIFAVLERAYSVFEGGRPRPVHIEIPLEIMNAPAGDLTLPKRRVVAPKPCIHPAQASEVADLCDKAERPIILAGGGARGAAAEIKELAERLNAPVVTTINGRGILGNEHPLALNESPSLAPVREVIAKADLVLALGTELGPTDFDVYKDGGPTLNGTLVRIDVDSMQLKRNFSAQVEVLSDVAPALQQILSQLPEKSRANPLADQVADVRAKMRDLQPDIYTPALKMLDDVWKVLPNAIVVGDSTEPIYAGNDTLPIPCTGRWFNSATGYGTLGFGLPAAIGAKRAAPDRPVVCLIGDGGLQFSLPELAMAVEADIPLTMVVWDNACYGEIRNHMEAVDVVPLGVDLLSPDFEAIAKAFRWDVVRVSSRDALNEELAKAATQTRPRVILGAESV